MESNRQKKKAKNNLQQKLRNIIKAKPAINPSGDADGQKTYAKHETHKPAEVRKKREGIKFTDLVMALCTIALTYYTGKLFYETVKSGQVNNIAFLEISDVDVDSMTVGSNFTWTLNINNIGRSVIKEVASSTKFWTVVPRNYNSFIEDPVTKLGAWKFRPARNYIGLQKPVKAGGYTFENTSDAPPNLVAEIVSRKRFVFVAGRIIYRNSIDNKLRQYTYVVELFPKPGSPVPFPGGRYNFIYNENEDIPEQEYTPYLEHKY